MGTPWKIMEDPGIHLFLLSGFLAKTLHDSLFTRCTFTNGSLSPVPGLPSRRQAQSSLSNNLKCDWEKNRETNYNPTSKVYLPKLEIVWAFIFGAIF